MDDKVAVEAAEARLKEAMLSGDVDALGELLGGRLVFTNQDGARLSKADDLAAYKSGRFKIMRLDAAGAPTIRLLGDSALVFIDVVVAGTYDGQPFSGAFAYTRLWHRTSDRWQIEAAHCSSAAGI